MEYKEIGDTGVHVSKLCMGTMSFGGISDENESQRMFDQCLEYGINFFDCSSNYNRGKAEEILGRLIKGRRDGLIITSKVFFPTGSGVNDRGLSRRHVLLEIEKSLQRLGTDRIDFYFLHNFDESVSIQETLKTLDDLQRDGKIVYAGVSNWAAWQIARALGVSDRYGLAQFRCVQPMYNLVKRQAESEIFPMCRAESLGVVTYSPLGGGLLTGKYLEQSRSGRLVEDQRYASRYSDERYSSVAEGLVSYADSKGIDPATLAVAWVMTHPDVTAPIIGARNSEQLKVSLNAANIELDPQWRHAMCEISAAVAPAPATDRSENITDN